MATLLGRAPLANQLTENERGTGCVAYQQSFDHLWVQAQPWRQSYLCDCLLSIIHPPLRSDGHQA